MCKLLFHIHNLISRRSRRNFKKYSVFSVELVCVVPIQPSIVKSGQVAPQLLLWGARLYADVMTATLVAIVCPLLSSAALAKGGTLTSQVVGHYGPAVVVVQHLS